MKSVQWLQIVLGLLVFSFGVHLLRNGCDFRYTINHTKRICYSFGRTKILNLNDAENEDVDTGDKKWR